MANTFYFKAISGGGLKFKNSGDWHSQIGFPTIVDWDGASTIKFTCRGFYYTMIVGTDTIYVDGSEWGGTAEGLQNKLNDVSVFTNGEGTPLITVSATSPLTGTGVSGDPLVFSPDATHRLVTDTEKSTWNGKQDGDSDLTTIAGLTPSNDDVIQRKSGAWTNRTLVQVKSDLSLNNVDNTSDASKPVSTAQAAADAAGLAAAESYSDGLVVGLWDDRGSFDASGSAYPSSGGSGAAGAILKGDVWTVSVAGTLPIAQVVEIGDIVRSLVNAPGNTQANWAITQNNIGYTAENSANKNASGGYAGLTLFKINFKNVANTITSFFTNSNTVARTYTFQNRDGTIADDTDLGTKITANVAITGATKTKIAYDTKGLITSGTDATTADIADSSNKRYVTDAQSTVIGNTSGTNTGDSSTPAETTTTVGSLISGATDKATPVDADLIGLSDSAASNILKKLTWANLKATLNSVYQAVLVSGTNIKTVNSTSLLGSGDISTTQTTVSGNAGSATILQNARNIDGQSFNGSANITVIAPGTTAATSKATPVDADELPLVDSAASSVLKKLTWANLKAGINAFVNARTTVADAAYVILSTDKRVALTSITTSRIFTLPAANSVVAGYPILVMDESGSITTSITLTVQRAGADTIDGATSEVISSAYGFRSFISDGTSKWIFDGGVVRLNATQTPTNKTIDITTNTLLLAANSIPVNATGSSAGATNATWKDVAKQTYAGTISNFVGTTAPSGTATVEYQWGQVGKRVSATFWFTWSVVGTAITAFDFTIPSDMPLPQEASWTATSDTIASGTSQNVGTAQTLQVAGKVGIIKTGTGTYKFQVACATSAIKYSISNIAYTSV